MIDEAILIWPPDTFRAACNPPAGHHDCTADDAPIMAAGDIGRCPA